MDDLWLASLEQTLSHPNDAKQLQLAIHAHKAYLIWSLNQTIANRKEFIKRCNQAKVSEF